MRSEAETFGTNFGAECLLSVDERWTHVDYALSLGLPEVTKHPKQKGHVAMVGTGPSVLADLPTLRAWKGPIWAMNGALGLLLKHDITPTAWVSIDPMADIVSYLNETPASVEYFPASVCHPRVFDRLKELPKVFLWHLLSDLPLPSSFMQVGGGSTTACRAPLLCTALGYKRVTLFGVDSSWEDDGRFHADGRAVPLTGRDGDQTIEVVCENGKSYRTSKALLSQATYLGFLKQRFPGKLDVRGTGLAPDLCANLKGSH